MTRPVYVIGHLNPDTDSVCSAIAYANLKKIVTDKEYIPARAGKVNRETKFVLEYFGLEDPLYLADVRSRVGDMLSGEAVSVLPSTPLREVGILTSNQNIKTLPIVDEENHLLGLVTLGDIAQKYMQELGLENLGEMQVTVENILRTLNGRIIITTQEDCDLKGNVIIAAMDSATIPQRIKVGDVVILGDRERAQLAALEAGAACLIITGGYSINERVKREAKNRKACIISVPYDTFATARLINMSVPVDTMMKKDKLIAFNIDDLVDDVRKVMLDSRFRNYPVVDDNNKLLGVVSRYHLLALMRKQVILVDHNEKGQAVPGLEQAEILEVIDHHRLGDVQTVEPIYFRNEPVGCTATIVASAYLENQVEIAKEMAGVMLAAILSDTVLFKSPTCTEKDKKIATMLAEKAEVDLEAFGKAMFRAGSSLEGRTTEEIIFEDFKEFPMGDMIIGIGQVETMDKASVDHLKAELIVEMERIRKSNGYGLVLLMVTDILDEATDLIVVGDKEELIEKAFNATIVDSSAYLAGVMSRKKQVVPPLAKVFNV